MAFFEDAGSDIPAVDVPPWQKNQPENPAETPIYNQSLDAKREAADMSEENKATYDPEGLATESSSEPQENFDDGGRLTYPHITLEESAVAVPSFSPEQIAPELKQKLDANGIKVEVVETASFPGVAIYSEDEKVLRVRNTAEPEMINDYIKDFVFMEQDEPGPPPSDEEVKGKFSSQGKEEKGNRIYSDEADGVKLDDSNKIFDEDHKEGALAAESPEPVPVIMEEDKPEKAESSPMETLRAMGFDIEFQPVFDAGQSRYVEGVGDPHSAQNILDALKILGVTSSNQIEINNITIGRSTFYAKNLMSEEKDLFVSPDIPAEELADFINFAIDKFKQTNATVGYEMFKNEERERGGEKEKLSEEIENSQSLDELYEVLRKAGGIQGSGKFYNAEELITLINIFVNSISSPSLAGHNHVAAITRAEGLRDKVEKLAAKLITEKPTHDSTPVTPEPSAPELQSAEQLQAQLEKMRVARAGIENDYRKGIVSKEYLENSIASYERDRKVMAIKLEEMGRQRGYSAEQINDSLFEEIIKKEHDEYIKALRDTREKNWKDTAKLEAAKILSSKAAQWYLKQNKVTRLAINTAVATAAGLGLGGIAAGAAGAYALNRLARGGVSVITAGFANKLAQKKWSIEEINEDEKNAMEQIRLSNEPLEVKVKAYEDITRAADRERKKRALKKAAVTIAAGAGAGILAGMIGKSVIEPHDGTHVHENVNQSKGSNFDQNRVARGRFGTTEDKPQTSAPAEAPQTEPQTEHQSEAGPQAAGTTEVSTETIFEDPSVLQHEVVAGDSTWKILNTTFEHNKEFNGLTEAQKTYVLGNLTSKVLEDPVKFGLGQGGALKIGDKADFSKLFEDSKEIKSILQSAKEKIATGGAQEKLILENNAKISTWLHDNPGQKLDESKVSEILNTKPKILPEEAGVKTEPAVDPAADLEGKLPKTDELEEMQKQIQETIKRQSELAAQNAQTVELSQAPLQAPEPPSMKFQEWVQKTNEIIAKRKDIGTKMEELVRKYQGRLGSEEFKTAFGDLQKEGEDLSKHFKELHEKFETEIKTRIVEPLPKPLYEPIGTPPPPNEQELINEIERAKMRLSELEGGDKPKVAEAAEVIKRNPNLERSLYSDTQLMQQVEESFKSGVNSIYGRSGVLGIGRIDGLASKNWGEMARLPAAKVVEYYTGDSAKSGLPVQAAESLSRSQEHQAFMKEMIGLMHQTDGAVKPYENENVEQFIKRVSAFIFKRHVQAQALTHAA